MDRPDSVESPRQVPRWRAYIWGLLALLTCPCHLPLLAAVLAGTTAGALIGDHRGIAAVTLAALFFLFLARAIRAFRVSV